MRETKVPFTTPAVCRMIMLAEVELRVGDKLEFQPTLKAASEGSEEWMEFCRRNMGKLGTIVGMRYQPSDTLTELFPEFSSILDFNNPKMLLEPVGMTFEVNFDGDPIHITWYISGVHMRNHSPRPILEDPPSRKDPEQGYDSEAIREAGSRMIGHSIEMAARMPRNSRRVSVR